LKMGRRLSGSGLAAAGSVTYRFRYTPYFRQSGSDHLASGLF